MTYDPEARGHAEKQHPAPPPLNEHDFESDAETAISRLLGGDHFKHAVRAWGLYPVYHEELREALMEEYGWNGKAPVLTYMQCAHVAIRLYGGAEKSKREKLMEWYGKMEY